MRPLQIGLVLDVMEDVPSGLAQPWSQVRAAALQAEATGFDTVWVPDELLWQPESFPGPRGFWEAVAVTSAVAEATSRIQIGTWVLSALHRNPALTAKVATTLDEISDGRFLLGFGAGHSGPQGAAFGFPAESIVGRYEEALEVLVPLLRAGEVEFEGAFHRASLVNRPTGPRPGGIPIMLAGLGPRTIRLAVHHADIWSAYAVKSSQPVAFADLHRMVDRACEEAGRDPKTLGRSLGVWFVPTGITPPEEARIVSPLTGPPQQVAEQVRAHALLGATSLELMVWPHTPESIEAAAEVLAVLDG